VTVLGGVYIIASEDRSFGDGSGTLVESNESTDVVLKAIVLCGCCKPPATEQPRHE
jgi:hypothetical protein